MSDSERLFRYCHKVIIQNTKDGPSSTALVIWLRDHGINAHFDYSLTENFTTEDSAVHDPISWSFYFSDPKAAVLFKLAWGGQ